MKRKRFIQSCAGITGAALITPNFIHASSGKELFNTDLIDEFVLAAHRDLDQTKKLIDNHPLILNCTSQIRRGDFETAIGGASHMGREDIAQLLVERGARLDIFNLCFLGYTEVVKQLIEISPNYLTAYGPHGFTLLHHAKMGEQHEFASWLQDKGLKEDIFDSIFVK
ncbi:MAG: hypothetical protein ACR2MM_07160 [Flavobacteriaceae bacterium]